MDHAKTGLSCCRCSHEWEPKVADVRICPRCKSAYWNKPRTGKYDKERVIATKKTSKGCFKCGEVKPLTEFYKHPQMADGYVNKCKECNKKDVSTHYHDTSSERKEYERKRLHDPHRIEARIQYRKDNPEAFSKGNAAYRKRHPEKAIAHSMVNNAIRDGKLFKTPCQICGDLEVEGHHPDYSKPLDVTWLCKVHHLAAHGKVPLAQFRGNAVSTARSIPAPTIITKLPIITQSQQELFA